jgi:hypothetical protein
MKRYEGAFGLLITTPSELVKVLLPILLLTEPIPKPI